MAPKQSSAETPAFQDRRDSKSTLTNGIFIQFDDSDMDMLPTALPSQTNSQGSKDTPIVIDSSPVRPTAPPKADEVEEEDPTPKPRKPLHPFFAPRAKSQNSNTRTTSRWGDQTRDLDPIYPDQESQHVKGIQSSYPSIPCPFERRMTTPSSGSFESSSLGDDNDDRAPLLGFLIAHDEQNEEPLDEEAVLSSSVTELEDHHHHHVSSINEIHISEHPAIARVVDAIGSDSSLSSSTQLWTEAWRPRHAKEVLGNEQSAVYLRNWLHTLALQFYPTPQENEPNKRKRKKKTKKRPRIVREVPRKKPRRDGLDWIVEDGEGEEEEEYITASQDFDSSQFSEFGEETFSAYASGIPEPINEQLHNTILLSGPPGSGKTAAVYACAEELGWEVFEVYPGIGRRNGANVDNLVGDVGKNHLVRKKQGVTGQPSIASLLSGGAGSSATGDEDYLNTAAASLEDQRNSTGGQQGDTEDSFRQSLILLEEVDLLFKDDVNFWPAVTNFIKDCRRPVICTCNGKYPGLNCGPRMWLSVNFNLF